MVGVGCIACVVCPDGGYVAVVYAVAMYVVAVGPGTRSELYEFVVVLACKCKRSVYIAVKHCFEHSIGVKHSHWSLVGIGIYAFKAVGA